MGFFIFGCLIAGYVLMLIIDYVHLLVIYKGCIDKIKNMKYNTSENCSGDKDMEYYCDYRVYSGILKFIFIFITAGCTFIEPMHSGSAISVTESVLVMGTILIDIIEYIFILSNQKKVWSECKKCDKIIFYIKLIVVLCLFINCIAAICGVIIFKEVNHNMAWKFVITIGIYLVAIMTNSVLLMLKPIFSSGK